MINKTKCYDYYILSSLYNRGNEPLKCGHVNSNEKHKLTCFLKNCVCIPNVLCETVEDIFDPENKIQSKCPDYGKVNLVDGRTIQVCGYSLFDFSSGKYSLKEISRKKAQEMYKIIIEGLDVDFYINDTIERNERIILLCMLMGFFCEKYLSESQSTYIRQLCQEISKAYKEKGNDIVEQVFFCVCLLLNYDGNDNFEWKNFLRKWYKNRNDICKNVCNDLEGVFKVKVKRNVKTLPELLNKYSEKNLVITVLFIINTIVEKRTPFIGTNGIRSMLDGVVSKITSELLSNNQQKNVPKPLHDFYNELRSFEKMK